MWNLLNPSSNEFIDINFSVIRFIRWTRCLFSSTSGPLSICLLIFQGKHLFLTETVTWCVSRCDYGAGLFDQEANKPYFMLLKPALKPACAPGLQGMISFISLRNKGLVNTPCGPISNWEDVDHQFLLDQQFYLPSHLLVEYKGTFHYSEPEPLRLFYYCTIPSLLFTVMVCVFALVTGH